MIAQAGAKVDRATGGGQTLVDNQSAGNTIAFTAQNTGTDDAARGNVTYIDRTGGTGQSQVVNHGTVKCLVVDGSMAEISGVWDNTGGAFQVFVVDNGQGAAAEDDAVTVTQLTTPTCDDDFPDDEDQTALARGNAQVYDAP